MSCGCAPLIALHQARIDRTRARFFPGAPALSLVEELDKQPVRSGVWKWRVTYGAAWGEQQFSPYEPRPVNRLRVVTDDAIDYTYKRTDRTALQRLFAQRADCDDVLIVRRGFLTDTSICNVALRHRLTGRWFTPRQSLLHGVRQQQLLAQGRVAWADLRVDALQAFDRVALFNALLPFGRVVLPMSSLCF